jgi:oligosaccharide 4-alpha-D-glucosyltransferase
MKSSWKIIGVLLMSTLLSSPALADTSTRKLLGHSFENGTLILELNDGSMVLTPYSEQALEAVFTPTDGASELPSFAIGREPGPVDAELVDSEDSLSLQTAGLCVDIQKTPFQIRYRFKGQALIEEECGYMEQDGNKGFRFRLSEGEKIFGGGSRALGKMDRRGERLDLYNSACYGYEEEARLMYYSMPAVVSSKKYMLVFDNSARGHLDIDSAGDGILQFDAVGGRMAMLLIAGDSWPDLSKQIADMTGHQPMLPRWALGNIASRMGYHNQLEVESVVTDFQELDIPLDAIVLDLFWFGESIYGNMGNLDWDRKAFPQPLRMMDRLKRQGVQTILITEPLILKESKNWTNAVEHKVLATDADGQPETFAAFFGEAGLVDMFSPAARDWFWGFYKKHTDSGVAGWWGDLGEPETHPDDIQHATGRGEDLHNAFGHEWARLVHEGFQKDYPDRRPFNLMRSGFVGTQRYGILPWSGDVNRSWGGFKPQVELALQMGLQGVAWMHSDLGGFAGKTEDSELYIRWMQYGVFQPIYRPHAHEEVPPEPIFWEKPVRDIVRESIQLRYKLLPYNYTLMFENAIEGLPLMRPLMFLDDRPDMEETLDAFLWGDAFLVAPITEQGATERDVPLPQGSAWFDFWTNTRYDGGQIITVPLTLETTPVFVKAGAFVPMIDSIQNTGEYDPEKLQIHFYADASVPSSTGRLYDDDGATAGAFKKKQFELLQFRSEQSDSGDLTLEIDGERHDYPGRPDTRNLKFIIHGLGEKPSAVSIDGQKIEEILWREDTGLLTVPTEWTGTPRAITIQP